MLGAPSVQARNANEKLNVGLIGCGNRGKTILKEVMKLEHNAVALCDIAEFRLDAMLKVVDEAGQDAPKTYADYRKLLEHKGLDAVIITTPDHHHKEQLLAAMQAEKDAYVEKPLTKSIDEGNEMVEAVRRANRIVQVGNQRHSGPTLHARSTKSPKNSRCYGHRIGKTQRRRRICRPARQQQQQPDQTRQHGYTPAQVRPFRQPKHPDDRGPDRGQVKLHRHADHRPQNDRG